MVFVKVRETYDLHTIPNKMSIIGIHTPKAEIIKKQYPGLLMQCKAYRPVSVDVKCACASMLPSDPLQVGVEAGEISPEDLFNPILYKTLTNKGMSQIESYVLRTPVSGFDRDSVQGDRTGITDDDFDIYYGLLSDTNSWAHANPQSGFEMRGVRPLVYEVLQTVGDSPVATSATVVANTGYVDTILKTGLAGTQNIQQFRGNSRPMPFLNCTVYTYNGTGSGANATAALPGFPDGPGNCEIGVPAPRIFCGCVIIPPSRLHQLYYRMVVEWTLEFTGIRSLTEITNWSGVAEIGQLTHYQSYEYSSAKAVAGLDEEKDLLSSDTSMVSTSDGMDIKKVM